MPITSVLPKHGVGSEPNRSSQLLRCAWGSGGLLLSQLSVSGAACQSPAPESETPPRGGRTHTCSPRPVVLHRASRVPGGRSATSADTSGHRGRSSAAGTQPSEAAMLQNAAQCAGRPRRQERPGPTRGRSRGRAALPRHPVPWDASPAGVSESTLLSSRPACLRIRLPI